MQAWFLILFFSMDFIGIHSLWLFDNEPTNLTLIVALYLIPIALLVSNIILPRPTPGTDSSDPIIMDLKPGTGSIIFIISCLAVIFIGIYIMFVPRVPLIVALAGTDDVNESRADSTLWIGGSLFKYAWLIVVRYLLPLITLASFIKARLTNTSKWRIISRLLIPLTYLSLMIDTQKAQVIFFSIQLWVAARLLHYNHDKTSSKRNFNFKKIAAGFGVSILAIEGLSLMYFLFMKNSHAGGFSFLDVHQTIVEAIFRRITITQARPLQVIFNAFPSHHHYLMGQTFPFSEILGLGERFDLSQFAYQEIYGVKFGAASTLFVSEFYANFGNIGVYVSIILFSILFVWLERNMRNKLRNPEWIVIYAYITGYIMRLAITQVIMGLALPVVAVILYSTAKKCWVMLNKGFFAQS